MKECKIVTLAGTILGALILISGAIAVPILCRSFYYAQIDSLGLIPRTDLTREQIKNAYNEMMDYCLGEDTFATGVLHWSQSGKDHFTDVRKLFLLDLHVLEVGLVLLAVLVVIVLMLHWRPARLMGRGPAFWAGAGTGTLFLLVGALAATDFNRAFVVFHTLFFPGKDNWLFDPEVDEIINILPEQFFMNCAILILVVLVAGCGVLIGIDFVFAKKGNRR